MWLWFRWRQGPMGYQVRETFCYFIDLDLTWLPLLSWPCLLAPSGVLSLFSLRLVSCRSFFLVGFELPTISFCFPVATVAVLALGGLRFRGVRYVASTGSIALCLHHCLEHFHHLLELLVLLLLHCICNFLDGICGCFCLQLSFVFSLLR